MVLGTMMIGAKMTISGFLFFQQDLLLSVNLYIFVIEIKTDNTMAKESKKQIKAQVINEVEKRYRDKITHLTIEVKKWVNEVLILRNENRQLKDENLKLTAELEKYEDWNRRLQEFMNMSSEEREQYITNMQIQTKVSQKMDSFLTMFKHLGLYI